MAKVTLRMYQLHGSWVSMMILVRRQLAGKSDIQHVVRSALRTPKRQAGAAGSSRDVAGPSTTPNAPFLPHDLQTLPVLPTPPTNPRLMEARTPRGTPGKKVQRCPCTVEPGCAGDWQLTFPLVHVR
jgi:hypothetical protein